MDARQAHFLVTVGALLDAARIGQLTTRLTLADGRIVEGAPGPDELGDGGDLDDTGQPAVVVIGGAAVPLAEVRQAAVLAPGTLAAPGPS